MSKSLIIGDLHLKSAVVDELLPQIKAEIGYDKVIYGGDYFDDFYDTPEMNRQMAVWVKEKLEDSNNILLLGNHDHALKWGGNPHSYCSGFTPQKYKEVKGVLTRQDFDKIKIYYVEQGILFSHAGLSASLLDLIVACGKNDEFDYTLENCVNKLKEWVIEADSNYSVQRGHFLYAAGSSRGGSQKVGGIIWCDASEFTPTAFNQIYFHSPRNVPDLQLRNSNNEVFGTSILSNSLHHKKSEVLTRGWGLDLDTHLRHFSILEDNILIIYKIDIVDRMNRVGKLLFKLDTKNNILLFQS